MGLTRAALSRALHVDEATVHAWEKNIRRPTAAAMKNLDAVLNAIEPTEQDPPTMGSRIRQARKRLNLTQAQLAANLGTTRTAVSQWENDRRYPSKDREQQVFRLLEATPQATGRS